MIQILQISGSMCAPLSRSAGPAHLHPPLATRSASGNLPSGTWCVCPDAALTHQQPEPGLQRAAACPSLHALV